MADSLLRVVLKGDATQLNSSLKTASARLTAFGSKMQGVASQMRSISIPLAIAGGAAVKMAATFDKSMTQIKSLVGVAGDEVDAMGERVKTMSTDIGVSSNEAAEALFFITSAGLRGEEAMQVLEASMKAASVGLGDTKTVADLATSAMNAYGSEVLSAADATDVMVSAVREGKLEASELAGSMGRVLPIASAMSIRFDEVGAAFAALSRTGTNAAEAATQIRAILTSLLKPTADAKKALAEMNLSSEGLRQQIREKGLLSALETLKTSFEGNDDATQRVFGNVRALLPIYDLLGANVQTTRDIFDSMTKSAGATEKAFGTLQESAEFKLRKSLKGVQNSLTDVGGVILESLLPHIQDLSESIKGLFEDFKTLDEDTQKAYIRLGEIIVVAPLIVSAIGTITRAIGGLSSAIVFLTSSAALGKLKTLLPVLGQVAALGYLGVKAADELTGEVAPDVSLWERLKIGVSGLIDPMAAVNNLIGAQVAASKESKKATEDKIAADEQAVKVAGVLLDLQDKLNKPTATASGGAAAKATGVSIPTLEDDLTSIETQANETAKALDIMLAGDSDLTYALATDSASIEYFGNIVADTAAKVRDPLQQIGETVNETTKSVSNLTLMIARDLAGAFEAVLNGENFFRSMIETLKELVKRLLAAAAAAALLALFTGGNFGAIFSGLSGLNLNANGMSGGGSVGTPTLGTAGNIPAKITPNGGVNLTGQFRIDGQDLVVAVERANKQRGNFITG